MMVAVLSATNLGHPDTPLGPSSDRGRASASAERAEPARAQDMASQCIEDLMEAYVDGDSSAFDELYRGKLEQLILACRDRGAEARHRQGQMLHQ